MVLICYGVLIMHVSRFSFLKIDSLDLKAIKFSLQMNFTIGQYATVQRPLSHLTRTLLSSDGRQNEPCEHFKL